jgi:hypothetical protein
MLTVSDVQALIVITLGDAFVLNRRVRQHLESAKHSSTPVMAAYDSRIRDTSGPSEVHRHPAPRDRAKL